MRARPGALGLVLVIVAAVACGPLRRETRPAVARRTGAQSPVAAAPAERRLIVELAPGQKVDVLKAAAADQFGAAVEVEPLFPTAQAADDPYDLAAIYVVRVPGTVGRADAWKEAYALKDRGGFPNVEPDLPDALNDPRRRSATLACLGDTGVPAPAREGWSLVEIRAKAAWAVPTPPGGKQLGEGARVCHIDTGYGRHDDIDVDRYDLAVARDLIDDDDDATDPLNYSGHPGHGTATGSVIASSGDVDDDGNTGAPGKVTGVAPKATIVPIRAITNVVQWWDSEVASAIRYSTDIGCDVISMSLGGRPFFAQNRAIKDAVARDVIVVAAAGNCVEIVVAPALFDDALAVAATNAEHKPWRGSSHGRKVAISAPGEDVYVARRSKPQESENIVTPGDGTSFATAEIAGAAALWVAFHGDDRLKAAQGGSTRQALFVRTLQVSAMSPAGWNGLQYGAGILDVETLLKTDPLVAMRGHRVARSTQETRNLELLARMLDVPPERLAAQLQAMFEGEDPEAIAEQWGPELLDLITTNPETVRTLRARTTGPASRRRVPVGAPAIDGASEPLKQALE